ncbi:iron-sulfur cluster assembly factor IBA57, mitochondrial [Rhynchophorus ferrugineus]|uniref:iron-sulfur cluster assembly factor IBA57, mitochondrial n=1 Tax=Rhynchophorus ferrugineus TaxID=354439 RepID=UPI003FCC83BB
MSLLRINKLFSTAPHVKNSFQHLKERTLIKVEGPDASEFLQGLITNDIRHISNSVGSMFTMFLNIKGRILFDTLIYKTNVPDSFWLECDSQVSNSLQKHLKMYKVRRRVDISPLTEYNVHVLFNTEWIKLKPRSANALDGDSDKEILPANSNEIKNHRGMLIFKDPRALHLGYRLISPNSMDSAEIIKDLFICETSISYKKLRYTLGIGEGVGDLSVGSSFPLECNCDYLHGVSFHKGCYIGQELTARTYHTGVIRKRLMPLLFTKPPKTLPENDVIVHSGVNVGKLKGVFENVGLALLRVEKALKFGNITVGDGEASVIKPNWWPIELPKEKQDSGQTSL